MTAAAIVLATLIAQAPRDVPAPATGAGSIAGTVVSDAQPPRPVRRAIVTVNSSDRSVGRTVVTDDGGRFLVSGLPSGHYAIAASKRGWVTAPYGAKAIGRPGSALSLTDGQRATVAIRMARGAVITGVVLDQNGQPPSGTSIRVLQYAYVPGRASGGSIRSAATHGVRMSAAPTASTDSRPATTTSAPSAARASAHRAAICT